jgi:hypothetical protein
MQSNTEPSAINNEVNSEVNSEVNRSTRFGRSPADALQEELDEQMGEFLKVLEHAHQHVSRWGTRGPCGPAGPDSPSETIHEYLQRQIALYKAKQTK